MKIGSLLIAAIMIFSIASVTVLAASNGKGKPDWAGAYEDQKEQFEEAREQFRNKAMNEKQFTVQVQKYLDKSIDKINSIVSKVRARVNDPAFDQFLNQTRLRLWNATNRSEILDVVKDMKHDWKDFRIKAKYKLNDDASNKLNGIILNANGLARKIDLTIQRLADQGVDTSNLTAKLAQFNEKINLAYGNWTLAHERLRGLTNDSDIDSKETLLNEAHLYLKASHLNIKEAHQILKDLVRELKGKLGRPLIPENETETTPPTLSMITPLENQTLNETIDVNVSASDNTNISSVVFKIGENGSLSNMTLYAGNLTSGEWHASWNTNSTDNGAVVIFVIAKDYFNNQRQINTTVNVNNSVLIETDTIAPNISIITPQPDQNVSGTIDVNVSASDNTNVSSVVFKAGANGTPSNLSLYAGNMSDGEWHALWDTNSTLDGTIILFVTARDYYNNSKEANLTVYVNNTG